MIKLSRGYSLGILVITIAVMIILTTTALVSYRSVSKDKAIANFMNDLQEVEAYVKEYYAENHILPVMYNNLSQKPLEIDENEYEKIRLQTDIKEHGKYYYIDLSKLERIHLNDSKRGYIVNENSLKVYVTNPIEFEGISYYTITDEMRGYNKTYNENANFEIIISGNPVLWSDKARLTLSIPNFESINSDEWQFKYYAPGPISAEEFKTTGKMFLYGEIIEIDKNGVVTFYAENIGSGDVGYAKTVNVVISKIDDIPPTIKVNGDRSIGGEIILIDNETGINPDALRYKIKGDDENNPEGGIPLITYGINYSKYIEEYNYLISESEYIASRISNFRALGSGENELRSLELDLEETNLKIKELNENNPSFNDGNVPYSDTERNIEIYVYDYAGNVAEDIDGVSRKVLLNSNLIDLDAKLLDNSAFSIVKTSEYTSSNKVNLRIRSQGATKMLITADNSISPENIANYTMEYESSNGAFEFDISGISGNKVTLYAYYTAEEYDDDGNLIYKVLSDSILIDRVPPTKTAPKIEISNKLKLTINVEQKDIDSGIAKIEYGYLDATNTEDITKYTWCNTVAEVESALKSEKTYYIRTRATDIAGNGPIASEYVKVKFPEPKTMSKPNAPVLGNMTAITWDENNEELAINATTLKDSAGKTRVWYDYKLTDRASDSRRIKMGKCKNSRR